MVDANTYSGASLVDTHCHLDLFDQAEVPALLARAREAGVGPFISVGVNAESSSRAIGFARTYPDVFAAVGIHPHDADRVDAAAIRHLKELAQAPKVVAIGETGLDYYRMRTPKHQQIEAFKRQVELAAGLDLPLIIHCRDAYDDMADILAQTRPAKVVLHCFSGGPAEAVAFMGLNCYISIAGTVTFKNAAALQEAVAQLPLESILLETDAPYLAPQPHRGQRNEPAYIKLTAAKVADIMGLPVEEVVNGSTLNVDKLFGLHF